MNKYTEVGLYDHNVESYEKIKKGFSDKDIVSIIHATGTGKSFNALQLAYDNKNKKTVYIVPSTSIIEHLKEIINENDNLNLGRDFPNLEFRTYQSLINMSEEELMAEANKWELSHGGISGRTAQQFINHCLGMRK